MSTDGGSAGSITLPNMFLTRRVSLPLAAALLLVVGTVACGKDGVEPDTWVRSVCGALTPWRTQIADLTAKAQQQMTTATTPQQTRTNLVTLLGGAERASEDARRGVAEAGVPAVDKGDHIAGRFTASLTRARDAYANARTTVEALPVGADPKPFYDGVASAFARLGEEYATSTLDTTNVGSTDLQRAFDEVPECQ